jgi:hypothetical protein
MERVIDSWDEAVAAEGLRFESDDESQKLKQQAAPAINRRALSSMAPRSFLEV